MKLSEAKDELKIKGLSKLSEETTVIVGANGHNRRATPLEQRMWKVIKETCDDDS